MLRGPGAMEHPQKWTSLLSLILDFCCNQYLRFNPMIFTSSCRYPCTIHSHTESGFQGPRDTRCDSVWFPRLKHKTILTVLSCFLGSFTLGEASHIIMRPHSSHPGAIPYWKEGMLRSVSNNQRSVPALWVVQVAPSAPAKHSDHFRPRGLLTENVGEILARNSLPSTPESLTQSNCERE